MKEIGYQVNDEISTFCHSRHKLNMMIFAAMVPNRFDSQPMCAQNKKASQVKRFGFAQPRHFASKIAHATESLLDICTKRPEPPKFAKHSTGNITFQAIFGLSDAIIEILSMRIDKLFHCGHFFLGHHLRIGQQVSVDVTNEKFPQQWLALRFLLAYFGHVHYVVGVGDFLDCIFGKRLGVGFYLFWMVTAFRLVIFWLRDILCGYR